MAWATTSRIRIAAVLGYPADQFYMITIDGAMDTVARQGQQAIDYIENLLTQWETLDAEIAAQSANAGLIQADVLKWSDRAGAKLSCLLDRLALIAQRIANLMNLSMMGGTGGDFVGISRKVRS